MIHWFPSRATSDFTYKWELIPSKSPFHNLLSLVDIVYQHDIQAKLESITCTSYVQFALLRRSISPLVSISRCRLKYLIDLMHLDLSTCTWIQAFDLSIAILLRTVSNGVIYVCDKHVTNIDKIISVGLYLSFRAHSLPSASTYCLRTSANISWPIKISDLFISLAECLRDKDGWYEYIIFGCGSHTSYKNHSFLPLSSW